MVASVKLNTDPQTKKGLKKLAAFQDKGPHIKYLKDQVTNQAAEVQDWRYAILDGVIHLITINAAHFGDPCCRPA